MFANRISVALILAFLVFVQSTAHPAAPATRPAAGPTTQRVNNLITALSSDDWKAREKAMNDLSTLGPLIEAQLRARLKENPDPATVTAIEALLNQIAKGGKIMPTLVTLKLTGASPAEALAAFAREANISFAPGTDNLWSDASKKIDVDFEDKPMWQALLELCSKMHVAVGELNRNDQIVLVALNDQNPPPPVAAAGPFLVLLSRVEVNVTRARDFAGPKPMNIRNNAWNNPPCRLYLFPFSEKKLKAIHWYIDSIDQCLTDSGQNLAANRGGFHGTASGRIGGGSRETSLTFSEPPQGKKITNLKLTARFVLQQGTQKLEIPNILNVKNSTQFLGGFRLVIGGVNKIADGQYSYDISVFRDAHSEAEFSLFQSLLNSYDCKLLDAKGQALSYNGGSASYAQDKLTFNNTLSCDRGAVKTGEPVKLEWEFPSPTEQIIVPLEFHDIELPQ